MTIRIQGEKYSFEIFLENRKQLGCFCIRAICKTTKRASCINNLNTILSELGVNPEKLKYQDSSWVVSKNEADRFMRTAQKFLLDKPFMKYLERRLDEDRRYGEWENIYHKKGRYKKEAANDF
jgi:hypothetical protein